MTKPDIGNYVYIWRGNTPDGVIQSIVPVRSESTETDNPPVSYDSVHIVPISQVSQFDPFWTYGENVIRRHKGGWWVLPPQTRCNCESLACETFVAGEEILPQPHKAGQCETKVDSISPTMPYLGKVCIPCAHRITDYPPCPGGSYLTWPDSDKGDKRC